MQLINDRPIRLALVGYGQIAKKHIAAIDQFPTELEISAICDSNCVALEVARETRKIDVYSSLPEMLEKSNADMVVITTPSGFHAQQTILAAQSGKHVVCEKPMATRWNDALEMLRACDESGIRLFVVKQNRAMPTLKLLKSAIDKGRFGRIYQVHANVFWTRPQDYYNQSRWRGSWDMDGGALMNQASHYVDLLHWLIGPVRSVSAMSATLARQIEAEDSMVLNLRYNNGALGSMSVSMLTYPKNLEASLTILGETGTVRIGGVSINKIELWQFADNDDMDQYVEQASHDSTQAVGFGHPQYYRNVIDTMSGKATAVTDGREGLKTMELLSAAYLSARDGITIHLPLEL
jgi:UDP-N-acetyl-2-amino-2-deoxyglucuronate dehydrogenase